PTPGRPYLGTGAATPQGVVRPAHPCHVPDRVALTMGVGGSQIGTRTAHLPSRADRCRDGSRRLARQPVRLRVPQPHGGLPSVLYWAVCGTTRPVGMLRGAKPRVGRG